MKKLLILYLLALIMCSCIPESAKKEIDKGMKEAQQMFADQEFKKAIANIELHKLRNGQYPQSLNELQFLSVFDSTMFSYVNYTKADSGYILNINFKFFSIEPGQEQNVALKYPQEFWKGLGCIKSNAKE